jgi:hypothetical protein
LQPAQLLYDRFAIVDNRFTVAAKAPLYHCGIAAAASRKPLSDFSEYKTNGKVEDEDISFSLFFFVL